MKNYSNPYQAPEVDKPRITPSEGMRGLFPTKDGWAEIDSKGNITKILTKDEFDAYKTDISEKFDKKADKSDVTNVYKFKGSVENIEDILIAYSLIPAGNPTVNGEVVGTYSSEGVCIKKNTVIPPGDAIKIPVKPIALNPGIYTIFSIFIVVNGNGFINNSSTFTITEPTTITEVSFLYSLEGTTFDKEAVLDRKPFFDDIFIGENTYGGAAEIGDVYNETSTGMNYAWTGTEWDALGGEHEDLEHRDDKTNPHSVTASQVGAYTKQEVDSKLSNKVNKSDVSNVYKFIGSVETFDDLPVSFKIIPKGNPTLNGVEVGTFNAEERSITFDKEITCGGWGVQIPIEPIVLPKGEYYVDDAYASICDVSRYDHDVGMTPLSVFEETTVTVIGFGEPQSEHTKSGKYYLRTVNTAYYKSESLAPLIIEQGAVYNVLDTGMNYAWTGTEWDALGGKHRDDEAHQRLDAVESQLDFIDSELADIIETQERLIGGDSV